MKYYNSPLQMHPPNSPFTLSDDDLYIAPNAFKYHWTCKLIQIINSIFRNRRQKCMFVRIISGIVLNRFASFSLNALCLRFTLANSPSKVTLANSPLNSPFTLTKMTKYSRIMALILCVVFAPLRK